MVTVEAEDMDGDSDPRRRSVGGIRQPQNWGLVVRHEDQKATWATREAVSSSRIVYWIVLGRDDRKYTRR